MMRVFKEKFSHGKLGDTVNILVPNVVEYVVQETHHARKHFSAQYQRKIKKRYQIFSKLTIKTSGEHHSDHFC